MFLSEALFLCLFLSVGTSIVLLGILADFYESGMQAIVGFCTTSLLGFFFWAVAYGVFNSNSERDDVVLNFLQKTNWTEKDSEIKVNISNSGVEQLRVKRGDRILFDYARYPKTYSYVFESLKQKEEQEKQENLQFVRDTLSK